MEQSWIAEPIEMTGSPYGYARVSMAAHDLSLQKTALLDAGVPEALIFAEMASGNNTVDRHELARLMVHLRAGDVLHVTRVDRLARSMREFARIAHDLKCRGIGLKVVQQGIDTTQGGAVGALTMNLLATFAQFENETRRERQMEGIAKAKNAGKYKGRKPLPITPGEVKGLREFGLGPSTIASKLNISRASVYRRLLQAS